MSLLLACYHPGMRLGQGFNSYTQQICINDAVQFDKNNPGGDSFASDESGKAGQIVTTVSKFVHRLSDVTDAMGVSGAVCIKTGAVGGAVTGSYIDSNKFKQSDLNFFVQVKVTNHIKMGADLLAFQKIDIPDPDPAKFTAVYGDSYISGFIEGGELDAIISIQVADKSKLSLVKDHIEATLGIHPQAQDAKEVRLPRETEVTFTINWSGGGDIKPPDTPWTLETLRLATARFPSQVALIPQRTYAILSPYQTLQSFLKEPLAFPLDYSSTGLYTTALMEAYMEYKYFIDELERYSCAVKLGSGELVARNFSTELLDLFEQALLRLKIDPAALSHANALDPSTTVSAPTVQNSATISIFVPSRASVLRPFKPTLLGLEIARRACSCELHYISAEIAVIATNPQLAVDLCREPAFIPPEIFIQLIPRFIGVERQDIDLSPARPRSENLPVLLPAMDNSLKPQRLNESSEANLDSKPYTPRAERQLLEGNQPINQIYNGSRPLFNTARQSVNKFAHKIGSLLMSDYIGGFASPDDATYFNDLAKLQDKLFIQQIRVWWSYGSIVGINISFNTGQEVMHGEGFGSNTAFTLSQGERIIGVKLFSARSPVREVSTVTSIRFITTHSETHDFGNPKDDWLETTTMYSLAPQLNWCLKGFYGESNKAFTKLGLIWGKE